MSLATERQQAGEARTSPLDRFSFLGRLNYKRQLSLLLLPYLFGLLLLVVCPALLSIPFAFTDYDALSPPQWIGLDNFQEMFADRLFWNGLGVSVFFIVVAVPLRVLGALFLAFLLHKSTRVNKFFRSLVYLPTIVPDVAYALLWLYIFNPLYGPLNWILPVFGPHTEGWMLVEWPARFGIVLMMLLPIGEGFVLMLAALQDIPSELQESAAVDGASPWQRFWNITMPLLAPAILLLFFRDTVMSFQITFVPSIITAEIGKPYYATLFLPVYIWQTATEYQNFGYAASMTWLMYIITAVVIFLQFVVARRWRNALYD
ncbi:MAG TPA: sugar ABC transporter permease [Chloroflexia bacterium]|nr:sugar ABC transporter permease [Chloroflexia bacterium]